MKPMCCGKPATPYKKLYNKGIIFYTQEGKKISQEASEEGFRCKKCGRIRIPWKESIDDIEYQREIEILRNNIKLNFPWESP